MAKIIVVRHYALRNGVGDLGRPPCFPVFSTRLAYRRHKPVRKTDEVCKVICKRCLALLAKQAGFTKDALPEAIQDKLMELGKLSEAGFARFAEIIG